MEVFRISRKNYAESLNASGYANRWNLAGQMVIYASSSRALATLELLVNRSNIKPEEDYVMMVISLPDPKHLIHVLSPDDLPQNWRSLSAFPLLQKRGSAWYKSQESLILKVPSVVIQEEFNFIINTKHTDFANNVSLIRKEAYFWDNRLYKK